MEDFEYWSDVAKSVAAPVPDEDYRPNALEVLGDKHKPSKRNHNYLRYYGERFERLRNSAQKVLEIGVETPRSLELWEDYFPHAEIFGIDIDPACARINGGRRKVFIGDQMDAAFVADVVSETGGGFDIIVDDGLHSEKAILTSFARLFPAIRPGGIYAVEDIINLPKVSRFFSYLGERVSYWPTEHPKSEWIALDHFPEGTDWLTSNTIGVSMYRYIVFAERGANPEINPFLMSREEYYRRKDELRAQVNEQIDAMMSENLTPTPDAISVRLGNRGLTTIREELKRRSLL